MNSAAPKPVMYSKRRFPGIPDRIQQYGLCILFHLSLPFLSLLIEAAVLKHVEDKTLFLFLAVYPLNIGVSSRSPLLFGFTIVIGLMYSAFFGLVSGKIPLEPVIYTVGYWLLSVVILVHAGERFNRHVAHGEPFWEFG
jgi:hypothetical protein